MGPKELNRVDVIRDISERRLRQKDAAELLKLSRRHIQRLVNQYRGQGPAGLISLRRGKPSNRRYTPEFKQRVIDIVRQFYIDFGPTFANEKSQEQRENTPKRTRSKRNISRAAQQRAINITLMKEPDTV
ncbi:helix-turn-helix domain-containing protein [Photobacterium phosphoreum]|uniref:helix-turn-helix domain-containing protein n=2 Tax=Photobacterium phosphoreum TaxID=659 RepID=UPI0015E63586|nr:helix-turn-helix domain-containing protein [Photobacterium phosphoreum]